MRQAVNNGYQQGMEGRGRADRSDRWPSNYQNSYGYEDANYGFGGRYLPQSDYNYYFREGFQRGYEDGYARRPQYGSVVNGSPSMSATFFPGFWGCTTLVERGCWRRQGRRAAPSLFYLCRKRRTASEIH